MNVDTSQSVIKTGHLHPAAVVSSLAKLIAWLQFYNCSDNKMNCHEIIFYHFIFCQLLKLIPQLCSARRAICQWCCQFNIECYHQLKQNWWDLVESFTWECRPALYNSHKSLESLQAVSECWAWTGLCRPELSTLHLADKLPTRYSCLYLTLISSSPGLCSSLSTILPPLLTGMLSSSVERIKDRKRKRIT